LTILAMFSVVAGFGQTTAVAGHAMGVTTDEWLAEAHIDCTSKAKGIRETCRTLSGLRKKDGWLYGNITPNSPTISWLFKRGRLAMVSVVISDPFSDQQMTFLREQYGQPASDREVRYQNGFGATYDLREALWNMPDGAIISANEKINDVPARWLDVEILTKEMAQVLSGPPPKNPYAK